MFILVIVIKLVILVTLLTLNPLSQVVSFARPVTVLVTDMSGFTRLTRTYGYDPFSIIITHDDQMLACV